MKTLILILCILSCTAQKEIQCYGIELTLIKEQKVFRYGSKMKWQTWEGSDKVLRMLLVDLSDKHKLGDKIYVLVKR
jgi:hypothetical protein